MNFAKFPPGLKESSKTSYASFVCEREVGRLPGLESFLPLSQL
jgi:hypothetical protein